jgi:O-antigen ligase
MSARVMNSHYPDASVRRLPSVQGSKLDKAIAVGLLVALVFSALAHGAVESWSVAIFEFIVVALILLWAIKMVAVSYVEIRLPATALPLVTLLGVGIAQSLAFADSTGRTSSLSLDVEATRAATLALLFLIVCFVIAGNFFADREQLQSLASFLIFYGMALAIFALVQHFTWNGRFYWLRPDTADRSTPFGPFVNRNHFAGYMELLMPLPVAMVITGTVSRDKRLLYLFAATIMSVAAVVSLSRGGMLALAGEMIFIAILSVIAKRTPSLGGIGRHREPRMREDGETGEEVTPASPGLSVSASLRAFAFTILLAALIVTGILWIGFEPVVNRLLPSQTTSGRAKTETFFTSRGWIWRDTVAMIRANPILGVGLGAYETAYPIYSRDDGSLLLGQSYAVDRAHNDYLQILADCGVVGGAIALWFIVLVFRAVARGIRSRDRLAAGMALGCGGSIFGMLVHSFFDFNLQLPSNALLFLLLAAIATWSGTSHQLSRNGASRRGASGQRPIDQEGVSL